MGEGYSYLAYVDSIYGCILEGGVCCLGVVLLAVFIQQQPSSALPSTVSAAQSSPSALAATASASASHQHPHQQQHTMSRARRKALMNIHLEHIRVSISDLPADVFELKHEMQWFEVPKKYK